MKTVGIIGGLGPESTSDFYLDIIDKAKLKNGSARPPVHIWNIPLPYKIEENLLTGAKGIKEYLPYLKESVTHLQKTSPDFIVLPCNTLHAYIEEIRDESDVPVLSIIEEVTIYLKERNITQIGLLATNATINEGLYQRSLGKDSITVSTPSKSELKELGQIINRIVLNTYTQDDRLYVKGLIKKFQQKGINDILLGCTDLQILNLFNGANIHDSLDILASSTVNYIFS